MRGLPMKTLTNVKDDLQQSVTPKKTIDPTKVRAIDHLQREYKTTDGTKLDVKPLWDNAYRLNFWGQKEITFGRGMDNHIVHSLFVRVEDNEDGLKVKTYN